MKTLKKLFTGILSVAVIFIATYEGVSQENLNTLKQAEHFTKSLNKEVSEAESHSGLLRSIVSNGSEAESSVLSTIWIFNGDATNVTDHSAYTKSDEAPDFCSPGEEVPCFIVIEATNQTELQALFQSLSENEIMDLAPEKRSP